MRNLPLILAAFALVATASAPTFAAPACRDAKGKFVKCADKKPTPKRCRSAKGTFVKCGTPGAKPV